MYLHNIYKLWTYFIVLTIGLLIGSPTVAQQESTNAFALEEKRLNKLLSIKQNSYHINKIVKDGVKRIQYGDRLFLETIGYDSLLLFITGINNLAKEESVHPFYIISKNTPDRIVKMAIMGGLTNKDPRIRLFTLTTLRQMKLNTDFKTINKILSITKSETVYNSYYYFIDINLNVHIANLNIELILLKKEIRRMIATRFIKSYTFDPISFVTISRANFIAINENILDEDESDIPLNTFDESKLNHLISGLANKDPYVKTECAKHIYNIYNDPSTSTQAKTRIDKLLKYSFSFEKEMLKEKYRMDFLFRKEPYDKFIIEGSSILKTVFLKYDEERSNKESGQE